MKKITGIDVSKNEFHSQEVEKTEKGFIKGPGKKWKAVTEEDINAFIDTLEPFSIVVMEATGNYHKRLAHQLFNRGMKVYVENPRYIKHYGKMRNNISKTDKNDAYVIGCYGYVNLELMKPYAPPREDVEIMKQRRMAMEGFKKRLQQINGQLESLSQLPKIDEFTKTMLEEEKEDVKLKICKIQESIDQITGYDLKQTKKLLMSIPGIGNVIATEFVEVLSGFVGMDEPNAIKKFIKFIGLAPSIHESGKSVRKGGHITRSGSPSLRAKLYMGASAAVNNTKNDNPLKTFFKRLTEEGKTYKQAIVAVMKKLARLAFAVVKGGMPYDEAKYGVTK